MDTWSFPNSRSLEVVRRFGLELRRHRTLAGLTQRQLADRVRYSREMIAAVERGRRYGSAELAWRCDEILRTGGTLRGLWPQVEREQVAADRRRGPRPEPNARSVATGTTSDWSEWAESIQPAIDEAPPELMVQLRALVNSYVLTGRG